MATIEINISIPDDHPDVVEYGIGHLGESALDYMAGWNNTYSYASSSDGPDDPQVCGNCGHAPHRNDDLSYRECCTHPMCAVE